MRHPPFCCCWLYEEGVMMTILVAQQQHVGCVRRMPLRGRALRVLGCCLAPAAVVRALRLLVVRAASSGYMQQS